MSTITRRTVPLPLLPSLSLLPPALLSLLRSTHATQKQTTSVEWPLADRPLTASAISTPRPLGGKKQGRKQAITPARKRASKQEHARASSQAHKQARKRAANTPATARYKGWDGALGIRITPNAHEPPPVPCPILSSLPRDHRQQTKLTKKKRKKRGTDDNQGARVGRVERADPSKRR